MKNLGISKFKLYLCSWLAIRRVQKIYFGKILRLHTIALMYVRIILVYSVIIFRYFSLLLFMTWKVRWYNIHKSTYHACHMQHVYWIQAWRHISLILLIHPAILFRRRMKIIVYDRFTLRFILPECLCSARVFLVW